MDSDSRKELWVGIFFLILSAAYMIGTKNISTFTPFGNRGLDSRSVPLLIGFLSFILASVHLVLLFFRVKKMKNTNSGKTGNSLDEICDPDEVVCVVPPGGIVSRIETIISVKLLLSALLLTIYFASYQTMGFVLSSIFFLIAETFLLTKKEKRRSWALFIVAFSVSASVIIYILFTRYLSLFLPAGILG